MANIAESQTKFLYKTVVFFVITFGFGLLPAPEPLTPYGMKTLGIFFGMLYGWCAIDMIWPSIVGILAMTLLGILPLGQVFANGWGSSVMLLIFFMMMVAKNLEKAGISKFIALWFISRKIVLGRPWLFSYSLLIAIAVVTCLTSACAMVFLGWVIFYDIMDEIKLKKYDSYANFMLIGIVIAACLGDGLFPFRTVGAVAFVLMEQVSGYTLNMLTYTLYVAALDLLLLGMYILIGKYIFHISTGNLSALNEAYFASKDFSLSKKQKIMLGLMALLVVMMLLPSVLPGELFIAKILNTISATGVAALTVLLMCIIRVDGEPLMEPAKIISSGVSFEVMFLGAAVLPLALKVFSSEEAGINAFIVQLLGPVVEGKPPFLVLVLAALCAVALTNVMINVTVPTLLYPAFYPIAVEIGISPVVLMVVMVFSCLLAFLLPSASPMAAIMFGNDEYIPKGDIYKFGGTFIATSVAISLMCIPIIEILFAV